jgi:dienelactone hydrolase
MSGKTLKLTFSFLAPAVLCTPLLMAQQHTPSAAEAWLSAAGRPPALTVPASLSDWEQQRLQNRQQILRLLGELPPRPLLPEVKILSREDRGKYVVEKFEFDNDAGSIVPGYILLPKGSGSAKRPAILYCHWHGGEYDIGKEEIFQAHHTPEPPGPTLAERGYVVLAIDAYCFGERNGKGPGGAQERNGDGEMTASKFNLWVGRTLWGMILRDDIIALDYLAVRPEVDPRRIGVMGMSMGATRSWWLMALDERLKTGVAVACLTRYQELIRHEALRAHGIYYFVPGFLNHFDTEAVIALIAPRPVLLMNGDRDVGSPVDGIRAVEAAVKPVYELYGQSANFRNEVYSGVGHVYMPEMWAKTLTWFDGTLSNEPARR